MDPLTGVSAPMKRPSPRQIQALLMGCTGDLVQSGRLARSATPATGPAAPAARAAAAAGPSTAAASGLCAATERTAQHCQGVTHRAHKQFPDTG